MDYSPLYSLLNRLWAFTLKQVKWVKVRVKRHFRTKKNRRQAIYVAGIVIIILLLSCLIGARSQVTTDRELYVQTLVERQAKLHKLQATLKQLQTDKTQSDQEVHDRDLKLQDTQKQIDNLNAQLQAKAAQKSIVARATSYIAPQVASASSGCGDNEYAHYIYMNESGCRTTALNAIGCYGIGQACPASKIAQCGADYACQNAWFTNYANTAYGGWAGAYAFWVSHHWW